MSTSFIDVTQYSWHVLLNPNACNKKSSSHWTEIEHLLSAANVQHTLHLTEGSGAGTDTIKQLINEGNRHFLVLGGDGTINEMINGAFNANVNTKDLFIAAMPLGSGNDWTRTHLIPADLREAIKIFLEGKFMTHDVGVSAVFNQNQEIEKRHFININSYGYSAEVIYDINCSRPALFGINVYLLSAIRQLFKYKPQHVHVETPNGSYDDKALFTVVANCKYNGGGMQQAPMAIADDGLLDIVIIPAIKPLTVIMNLKRIFAGKHLKTIKGVQTFRTNHVSISSDRPLRSEMEGELLKLGRFEIDILPQAINMLTGLNPA